jgi:hypothetical protein
MWFKAGSPSYAGNMKAAGNLTMEYGFHRGIWSWGGISFVVTTRGNHDLVFQKGGNLHCFFWRLNFLFFFNPNVVPEGNIIIEGKISPNPTSGGHINDNYSVKRPLNIYHSLVQWCRQVSHFRPIYTQLRSINFVFACVYYSARSLFEYIVGSNYDLSGNSANAHVKCLMAQTQRMHACIQSISQRNLKVNIRPFKKEI